ncbi:MAG: hypothetical protein KH135_06500 [Firmicutes bacterium]|nr:hypothetical protein [Bacillota bacterium]
MKNKMIYHKKLLIQLSIIFIVIGGISIFGALAMKDFDVYAFQRGKKFPWYRVVSIIEE